MSNARARGVELGAAWQGCRGLTLRVAYTFLDTEIRAVDGTAQAPSPYRVGDPLLRRPRHQGLAHRQWALARVTMFAGLEARGKTLDAEPAFGPSGGLYRESRRTPSSIVGGGYPHRARRRGLRARAEPLRSRLRRSARLPIARPHRVCRESALLRADDVSFAYRWLTTGARTPGRAARRLVLDGGAADIRAEHRGHSRPERLRQDDAAAAAERHPRPTDGAGAPRRHAAAAAVAAGGRAADCRRSAGDRSSPSTTPCMEMVLMGRHPHLGLFELEGPADFAVARDALARDRHRPARGSGSSTR